MVLFVLSIRRKNQRYNKKLRFFLKFLRRKPTGNVNARWRLNVSPFNVFADALDMYVINILVVTSLFTSIMLKITAHTFSLIQIFKSAYCRHCEAHWFAIKDHKDTSFLIVLRVNLILFDISKIYGVFIHCPFVLSRHV